MIVIILFVIIGGKNFIRCEKKGVMIIINIFDKNSEL